MRNYNSPPPYRVRGSRRRFLTSGEELGGLATVGNGVYIQDINGRYWTEDMWDGSVEPNGVAVIADECSFVIALSQKSNIPVDSNGYSSSMTLTTYSSSSDAIKNYAGSSNTTAMVSAYGSTTSEAAGYCRSFTFPNGKKGYLGSAGEWQAAYDNKSAIATCMSKAGGTVFGTYYWSSTRAMDCNEYNCFWDLRWSNGSWYGYGYAGIVDNYARPFSAL